MTNRLKSILPITLVIIATLMSFPPLLFEQYEFLHWDDMDNIVHNPGFKGFDSENFKWMFFSKHLGVYEPASWLLKSFVFSIFGLSANAFHLVTLLLHCISSVLLFLIALRLFALSFPRTERKYITLASALTSLLFAVHPLRAEIVAWASGQSYALAGCFFLSSILAYLKHRESKKNISLWLASSLLFYVMATLSKPAAVMLPLVLIILDYYPLRTFSIRTILEKIPYLAFMMLLAVAAGLASRGAQEGNLFELSFLQKLARASYALVFYIQKTIWPVGLSPHYKVDIHEISLLSPKYFLCLLAVSAVTVAVVVKRKKHPWALASWSSYLVVVSPMLGFIQHGTVLMAADRYTYLSSFGLLLIPGAALIKYCSGETRSLRRSAVISLAAVALLVFTTIPQVRIWRNTETLWSHAIRTDNTDPFVYNNLGFFLMENRRFEEAAQQLERAVALAPQDIKSILNYGVALENLNRLDEAVIHYLRSLKIHPNSAIIHNNLGSMLMKLGKTDLARQHWQQAIALDPNLSIARKNLVESLSESALESIR